MDSKRPWYHKLRYLVVAILALHLLVVYTPLRKYLPGYLDSSKRAMVEESSMRLDSLERASRLQAAYLENMIAILSDRARLDELAPYDSTMARYGDSLLLGASPRSQAFVARYEEQERFGLSALSETSTKQTLFLTPVSGEIKVSSASDDAYAGVDVEVSREMPVLAPLEGTIVSVSLVVGQGYLVAIQHAGDYVTLLSHLSTVLVDAGQQVKAGRVVGHVGGKNPLSSQSVNIQIWHQGMPVDPASVMVFPL